MSENPSTSPAASPQGGESDRKAVRLRKYIDLVVEDKLSFTLLRAVAADISSTGMRILCDQYLPPKTKYTFTMKQFPHIVARGEVRWVRPSAPNMHQCGVLFIELADDERQKLERFLVMEHERAMSGTPQAASGTTPVSVVTNQPQAASL